VDKAGKYSPLPGVFTLGLDMKRDWSANEVSITNTVLNPVPVTVVGGIGALGAGAAGAGALRAGAKAAGRGVSAAAGAARTAAKRAIPGIAALAAAVGLENYVQNKLTPAERDDRVKNQKGKFKDSVAHDDLRSHNPLKALRGM